MTDLELYTETLDKMHQAVIKYLRTSSLTSQIESVWLGDMTDRLSRGDSTPEDIISYTMSMMTQETMQDFVDQGYTVQEAYGYTSSTPIPNVIKQSLYTFDRNNVYNYGKYSEIVDTIDWQAILDRTRDQLSRTITPAASASY